MEQKFFGSFFQKRTAFLLRPFDLARFSCAPVLVKPRQLTRRSAFEMGC
jgi:hypothetical protein